MENQASEMYKEHILENYKHPNNFGEIKNPSKQAESFNSSCGDEIRIQMIIEKGNIKEIKFKSKACAICTASASLLTENVKGKNIQEIKQLKRQDVLNLLEIPIGPVRLKCALLPLETLHKCLQ